jgi:hypothetical protein
MIHFQLPEQVDNPRIAGVAVALLSYLGGEAMSGAIDLTRLLAAAISGVFGVIGWLLVTLLNHWLKRKGRRKEDGNSYQ